jgi:two-component system NtrC family sensor kinase
VLDQVTRSIRERKQAILSGYRAAYRRTITEWVVLVLFGVASFGGFSVYFFRRLSNDIAIVKSRATAVARGFRGGPLNVTRDDELGDLMVAVNRMQEELRQREVQIELGRQQQFHTEKMAAVGALAAAVAHEINNPLAAIVGVAENIVREAESRSCCAAGASCQPGMILEQARRVMAITRQISEFSLQRPAVAELVDLNALVRSTSSFVGFDKRFRGIQLDLDLGKNLPAIEVVSDHIVQVLMNVLINAADAFDAAAAISTGRRIVVRTEADEKGLRVFVVDNGIGIPTEVLDRVFDEYFTTKAPGRGTGLGLSLCWRLMEQAGGSIHVRSELGAGTTVDLEFPVPAPT